MHTHGDRVNRFKVMYDAIPPSVEVLTSAIEPQVRSSATRKSEEKVWCGLRFYAFTDFHFQRLDRVDADIKLRLNRLMGDVFRQPRFQIVIDIALLTIYY